MREPYGKRLPSVQPGWRLAALVGWLCLAYSSLLAQDRRESVLDVLVEEYSLSRADMAQALRILRGKAPNRILIGFETVSGPDSRPVLLPDLRLRNQTVGQILRRLCQEDPRYAFELPGDPRIVNVYWKSTRNSASNLLNLRITRFDVDGPVFPQNLIRSIDSCVPELREYLQKNRTRQNAPAAPPGASPRVDPVRRRACARCQPPPAQHDGTGDSQRHRPLHLRSPVRLWLHIPAQLALRVRPRPRRPHRSRRPPQVGPLLTGF